MAEHVPWAEKWQAEVDAFFRLWRERRWLAVLLLIVLIVFTTWSIYTNWSKSQSLGQVKSEKERLESQLRESERENRGLRETVAPLLARAAKEFPGEEINSSLKKIVARLEGQDPLKQPIASATATVELTIKSQDNVSSHFMDKGGYVALAVGPTALIEASAQESWGQQTGEGEVKYRGVFSMPADGPAVDKPVEFLRQAKYLQTEFLVMPTNSCVVGGKVIFVINNLLRLEFQVPPQTTDERRVFVRDIAAGMKPLAPNN